MGRRSLAALLCQQRGLGPLIGNAMNTGMRADGGIIGTELEVRMGVFALLVPV